MRQLERWESVQPVSDYIDARVLSTTQETFDVPAGASYVLLSSSGTVLLKYITSGEQSDLVTNGTFAADTDWTKAASWTIDAGVASSNGDGVLSQSAPLVAGKVYEVKFTMTRTGGTLTASLGGQAGTGRSTANTFTENVICGGSDSLIAFTGSATYVGNLDNVTVKPVASVPTADDATGNASELLHLNYGPVLRSLAGIKAISAVATDNCYLTLAYYS